jgi:hypothetical protein
MEELALLMGLLASQYVHGGAVRLWAEQRSRHAPW